jgi:transposase
VSNPHLIAIGCDSSKGRIDVEIRNHHGTVLHVGAFDDTPDDHVALSRLIDGLRERHPEARLLVGIESTGGMERNWLAFFRREKRWAKTMRVFRLNAAAVHAFRAAELHRAPGDAAAASDIARFLLERCATRQPAVEAESGPIVFYRTIRALSVELTATSQRLQTLLVAAQPELVRFCRYGLPGWILALLARYPTAVQLAKAPVAKVDAIAHIDGARAADLVEQAKRSVASLTDAATAATIRLLVARIADTQASIDRGRAELLAIITAEPESPLARAVVLLDGIPGIAPWSAACLACEIGEPARFAHAKAIIAWAGLDPIAEASGDQRHDLGISHRGNAHVRAILFPLAMAGILHNPVLKDFHHRLTTENGKTHLEALVAVMAKLLRIAHAILLSGKPFDRDHEAQRRQQTQAAQAARSTSTTAETPTPPPAKLDAPISRREATRRKKAAAPGAEVRDQSPKRVPRRGPHAHAPAIAAHAKG